jgi:ubiquinone/menaquinone biosynthesis C-methylase UbiE
MNASAGYASPEYLEASAANIGHFKQRTYDCMKIGEGAAVLDVGCGPGIDTVALARIVGPGGQVFGIDHDPHMIAEADQRAGKEGVSAWVRHQEADAASLPFDTATFDACRSERLFQHLPDPAAALREMARVTRPGGSIVVLDTDWGGMGADTQEVDIERRLFRFHAEQYLTNGFSGRQLYRLLKKQGLQNVAFEVLPLPITDYGFARESIGADALEREAVARKVLTEDELSRLHADLEQAQRDGVYFSYGCMLLVWGRKAG